MQGGISMLKRTLRAPLIVQSRGIDRGWNNSHAFDNFSCSVQSMYRKVLSGGLKAHIFFKLSLISYAVPR